MKGAKILKGAGVEMRGKFLMVNSISSESQGSFTDEGVVSNVFLSTKTVHEHVVDSEKVIDKVHFILKYLNITISHYDS